MSYKILRLSPLTTKRTRTRIALWKDLLDQSNQTFAGSSLVYGSQFNGEPRSRINVALGMLLVAIISATFWAGVGVLVAQIWK